MTKFAALLFTCSVLLSGVNALAQAGDDDDDAVPVANGTVPDAGSSALLAGCAVAGLAGLRFYFKRK